jgi:hypothetical protein
LHAWGGIEQGAEENGRLKEAGENT